MGLSLFRKDTWEKLLTGFGMLKDKSSSQGALPGFNRLMPVSFLILYFSDVISNIAVDIPI